MVLISDNSSRPEQSGSGQTSEGRVRSLGSGFRRLFVYGDFGPGLMQTRKLLKLGALIHSRQSGVLQAAVQRLSSGLFVTVDGGDSVAGDILTLEASDAQWALILEMHGVVLANPSAGLFLPVEKNVVLEDGNFLSTLVFYANESKLSHLTEKVPFGDWQKASRDRPGLIQRLTPRQAEYIQKLAACTGRDVVPIDLNLYRELLRLEVAIDKGRRLALTALGHEVSRWLP